MNPSDQREAEHAAWLEKQKEHLSRINGLDPVEELLTQAGVRQHSHDLVVKQRDAAYAYLDSALDRIEHLKGLCARAADALETASLPFEELIAKLREAAK